MVFEVEIRSFISKEKYEELLEFLNKNAEFLKESDQESHYFDSDKDLRIQRNDEYCKVWLKKGLMHETKRQEIELRFDKKDFEKAEELFGEIGFRPKVKWFRKRREYSWLGFDVCLDYTKGYGYILEIEKLCEEKEKNQYLEEIKSRFKRLNIPITSKEDFDKKLRDYENNWEKLTKV